LVSETKGKEKERTGNFVVEGIKKMADKFMSWLKGKDDTKVVVEKKE
jgi:hypothetical protein